MARLKASAPKAAEKPAWSKRDKPEDKRERALGRLDTRRDSGERGAKPAFKRGDKFERSEEDRPKRKSPPGQSRTANVWMAPGARPLPKSRLAARRMPRPDRSVRRVRVRKVRRRPSAMAAIRTDCR